MYDTALLSKEHLHRLLKVYKAFDKYLEKQTKNDPLLDLLNGLVILNCKVSSDKISSALVQGLIYQLVIKVLIYSDVSKVSAASRDNSSNFPEKESYGGGSSGEENMVADES